MLNPLHLFLHKRNKSVHRICSYSQEQNKRNCNRRNHFRKPELKPEMCLSVILCSSTEKALPRRTASMHEPPPSRTGVTLWLWTLQHDTIPCHPPWHFKADRPPQARTSEEVLYYFQDLQIRAATSHRRKTRNKEELRWRWPLPNLPTYNPKPSTSNKREPPKQPTMRRLRSQGILQRTTPQKEVPRTETQTTTQETKTK